MKPNLKFAIILAVLFCAVALAVAFYIRSQDGRFWCDRQWAGLALYRGGYRSWSLTFCDGFMLCDDGQKRAITIDHETKTVRMGYHFPRFAYKNFNYITNVAYIEGPSSTR